MTALLADPDRYAALLADSDRYAALLAAGAADRWKVDTAIPWDRAAQPPRWLPRQLFVRAVSQLYHGEVATAAMCLGLADELAEASPTAAACLRAQADDEVRHAAVFERYLHRLGGIAPIDPPLAAALEAAAAADLPPVARMGAFNIVLEGEGVLILHAFARYAGCPLLTAIVQRTGRDEARHVAFGKRFVAAAVADLNPAEKVALAARIEAIWDTVFAGMIATYAGPFGARIGRGAAGRRWHRHAVVLQRLGVPVRGAASG